MRSLQKDVEKAKTPSTTAVDSAMARHCLEKGHSYDGVQSQLLHACEKGVRMNRLEEIH